MATVLRVKFLLTARLEMAPCFPLRGQCRDHLLRLSRWSHLLIARIQPTPLVRICAPTPLLLLLTASLTWSHFLFLEQLKYVVTIFACIRVVISDGHTGATSAATFSVAVAAAPLLFFVTSDKRQRRCFFSQKSGSAFALFFKQIFCRCRYC